MNSPIDIGLRLALIAGSLGLWFWTQKRISMKPLPVGQVGDRIHDATAGLHRWLAASPRAADATLIVTSLLIDSFGLFLFGRSLFGPSVRPFVALVLTMALRQLCQETSSLPKPEGVIWRYPGFPSALVTYGVSNDFFFSGHTAIAVLGCLEIATLGHPWLTAAAVMVAVAEMATVLVLRAHYWMDVFAGALAAGACELAAGRLAPSLDGWLRMLH